MTKQREFHDPDQHQYMVDVAVISPSSAEKRQSLSLYMASGDAMGLS